MTLRSKVLGIIGIISLVAWIIILGGLLMWFWPIIFAGH